MKYDILHILLISIITVFLNEFVFVNKSISILVNIIVVIIYFVVRFISFEKATYFIFYITLLLFTRPRNLHLVDLIDRGDFDYYSPNIFKIGGFTITTLLLVCHGFSSLLLLKRIAFSKREFLFMYILSAVFFLQTMNFLFLEDHYFKYYLSDIKFVLFIFLGFMSSKAILTKINFRNFIFNLINIFLYFGIIAAFSSIFYLIHDFYNQMFLLKYNANPFLTLACLLIISTLNNKIFKFGIFKYLLFFILLLFASFPVTRGVQLNFLFILLSMILIKSKNLEIKSLFFDTLILLISLFGVISYVYFNMETLFQFFIEKLEFFVNLLFSDGLDKSASIRTLEFLSIINNSIYNIIFGSGFGGYFKLDGLIIHSIDLSDYPADQFIKFHFQQPHFFVSYFVLKFGVVFTFVFVWLFLKPAFNNNNFYRTFYLSLLFPIIWDSYWVPVLAYLFGFLFYKSIFQQGFCKNSL